MGVLSLLKGAPFLVDGVLLMGKGDVDAVGGVLESPYSAGQTLHASECSLAGSGEEMAGEGLSHRS